jgi:hypothetical protein
MQLNKDPIKANIVGLGVVEERGLDKGKRAATLNEAIRNEQRAGLDHALSLHDNDMFCAH